MTDKDIVNSDLYWNARFAQEWEASEGPRQSRFFARIAIEHLPRWLIEQLKRQSLTFADWGCAQGDGTDVWASYIDAKQIVGVDFSSVAIEQAVQRYPAIRFINEDWLTEGSDQRETFDVVFSSNTLEHFHKPYDTLNSISRRAKKAIILALPYKELERIDEHFFSFLPENIPLQLANGFRLIWSRVVDCRSISNTPWNADQIILVYADYNWVDSLGLTLSDYRIEQSDTAIEISHLNTILVERDGQIAILNQAMAERDGQIANLNQTVAERDGRIASVNQAMTERDGQIANLNQTVTERDGQIACLNQTLVERDGQIASLNQTMTERDGQIASLNQTMTERDGQIVSLNQTVAEREGQITSLNQTVVERDEQIASLNQAMAERNGQIANLNVFSHSKEAEILKLKSSTSWVLTRPLRFTKLFFQNPKKSAYDLVKFVYWRLPYATRQALHGPRHKFVRWVRRFPLPTTFNYELDNSCTSDLSWDDFNAQILSRRSEYKGIFIQESTIPWNAPLYQRPQHIACVFGRLGYLVLYRTVNWSDDTINGVREVDQNVWITACSEVDAIEGAVCSFYSTDFTIRPEMIYKRRRIQKIIYEYIDHIDPKISGDAENIRRLMALKDFAFGGGADYIVASARKLEAEVIEEVGRDKVILAQNGVDTRHYRNPIHQSTPLPENLISFRRKYSNIIGYFGALAPWLWYEAISELVEARPDLGFVFIGPDYYGGVEKLPKADNVQYLGTVDYKVLPAYARQFDVCFIPFMPGEIAKTTSPLKLFEYFALEKPVVVTSEMFECVAFKEVFSGDSASALSQAIDAAIQVKNDAGFKKRLAELAEENDWEARAKAMEFIFQCTLYEGIAKTFGVSQQFVRLYFMRQEGLGRFHKDSWEALYQALDPLQKLHVEFAMTTVMRGREIARLLDNNSCIRNKRRYLDVGTGFGGFLRAFKDFGFSEVVGIELQAHLAEYAKANIAGIESAQVLNVDFEEADCSSLGKFDLITCNDVIEHVKQPAIVIQKMTALVSESGCIALKVPNKDSVSFVKSDGHFQLFGITQLSREDAATYYSEALALSKDNYLFEMGESYELEWYLEKIGENGMNVQIFDTQLTGKINDMPNFISDLKNTYENWYKYEKPKLSDSVSKTVENAVVSYILKLEDDFNSLDDKVSKENFRNKYLRSFWTIVALK